MLSIRFLVCYVIYSFFGMLCYLFVFWNGQRGLRWAWAIFGTGEIWNSAGVLLGAPALGSCYVHPALLLGHPANSEVAKLPFNNSSSGRGFSGKFSEKGFPESFQKKTSSERRICDFRKYPQTTSERTSFGSFQKNLIPEVTFVKKKIIL